MLGPAQLQAPPHTLTGFAGPTDTLREIVRAAQGERGEQSLVVRAYAEDVTRGLHPKDYLGEILAIRNDVAQRVRYVNDPTHVELVKDPQRLVEEIAMHGVTQGDCDDQTGLICALNMALGRQCRIHGAGFSGDGQLSHVFAAVQEPKTGQWIVCDPVAGSTERDMLRRMRTWETWSLDEPPSHGPIERRTT